MKKQNIFNLLVLGILLLVSLGSCQEEDPSGQSADGIVLRIQTQQGLSRATEPGTEAEDKIDRVDAWFFPQGASDTTQPLLYYTVEQGDMDIKIDALTLETNGMSATGTYDVYVVANLPETGTTVTATSTPGDLKSCKYIATSRPGVGDASFCMSKWEQLNFSSGRIQPILLRRQAVKLNINLVNETTSSDWTINSVKVRGDQQKVALFEPATGGAAPASDAFASDLIVSAVASTDNPAAYTAYVYENLSDSPVKIEVTANIGGQERIYIADLMPDHTAQLPRNSICEVTLRMKDVVVVDVTLSISEWYPVGVNAPIHGVYLKLPQVMEVDKAAGGYLFVESDAQNMLVDWSQVKGVYLSGYKTLTEATVELTDNKADLHFIADAMQSDISGYISIKAGNILKKVSVEKAFSLLQFENLKVQIGSQDITDGSEFDWNISTLGPISISVSRNVNWFYTYQRFTKDTSTAIDITARGFNSAFDGVDGNSSLSWNIPNNNYGKDIRVNLVVGIGTWVSGTPIWTCSFIVKQKP